MIQSAFVFGERSDLLKKYNCRSSAYLKIYKCRVKYSTPYYYRDWYKSLIILHYLIVFKEKDFFYTPLGKRFHLCKLYELNIASQRKNNAMILAKRSEGKTVRTLYL